ncbi:hypothetical protein [uncultured Thomasclavelia sp.]|uniref:MutS-related protein n=1 Tax=uncultured Thomasclavelia sp. TaxID=3025759 RepID=UPI0025EAEC5F|nr:hypothetical protein [uncultured Thomasclavelia sp.]
MIILLIVSIVILIVLIKLVIRIIYKNYLYQQFTKAPVTQYRELTKEYYQLNQKVAIDENTFQDLEMPQLLKMINYTLSPIGNEYLYNCFFRHSNDFKIQELIIERLVNQDKLKEAIYCLRKLDKEYVPILSLKEKLLKYPYRFKLLFIILPFINLIFLGLGIIDHQYFYIPVVITIACILINFQLNGRYETVSLQVGSIKDIIVCSEKLLQLKLYPEDKQQELKKVLKELKKSFKLSYYFNCISFINIIGLLDLIKAILLIDVIQTACLEAKIDKINEELLQLYDFIGQIDTSISVMTVRTLYQTSIPQVLDQKKIIIKNGYHLLIKNPVKNSVVIDNNAIITGSNASGKSTFLKMLGANLLLAKAMNIAFSERFQYYPFALITSIHMKDDLENGYSFYVQEIKRLKKITNRAKSECCLVLIDEILKGTNETERLVIAHSILKFLFSLDSLTIVSTHDISLTKDFENVANYCFNDIKRNDEIVFDYLIKDGICSTGNAIAIVKSMDFDPKIIEMLE